MVPSDVLILRGRTLSSCFSRAGLIYEGVVVIFQNIFYLKKYINNIFLFLKSAHQNDLKTSKKNSNFLKNTFKPQCQTRHQTVPNLSSNILATVTQRSITKLTA